MQQMVIDSHAHRETGVKREVKSSIETKAVALVSHREELCWDPFSIEVHWKDATTEQ